MVRDNQVSAVTGDRGECQLCMCVTDKCHSEGSGCQDCQK